MDDVSEESIESSTYPKNVSLTPLDAYNDNMSDVNLPTMIICQM